jgi:hypothetical protein
MISINIKKMPANCYDCKFCVPKYDDGFFDPCFCSLLDDEDIKCSSEKRLDICPLKDS